MFWGRHVVRAAEFLVAWWSLRRGRGNLANVSMRACFPVLFQLGVNEGLGAFPGGMFCVVALVANYLAVDLSVVGSLFPCLNSYR